MYEEGSTRRGTGGGAGTAGDVEELVFDDIVEDDENIIDF